jgi:hypothetical protein
MNRTVLVVDNEYPSFLGDLSDPETENNGTARFECIVSDNVGIAEVKLEFLIGITDVPLPMNRTSSSRSVEKWTLEVHIPIDEDRDLVYRFTITDVTGWSFTTEDLTMNVTDPILPDLAIIGFYPEGEPDNYTDVLTTGDDFNLVLKAKDNIAVMNMTFQFKLPEREEVETIGMDRIIPSSLMEDRYIVSGIAIPNSVGSMHYRVMVSDKSSEVMTEWLSIPVVDNDPPVLSANDENLIIGTGQTVYTTIRIMENIEVTSYLALVQDHPDAEFSYVTDGENLTITIVMDETFPSTATSLSVTVSDGNNSAEISIPVIITDMTPPTLGEVDIETEMKLSTEYALNVVTSDNDAVDNAEIVLISSTGYVFEFDTSVTVESVSASIPPPGPGKWTLKITIWDPSGNSANRTVSVIVTDDIEPEVVITDPKDDLRTGETLTLSGVDTIDDSELVTFTWTIVGPDGSSETLSGVTVEYTPSLDGEYEVTLEAKDSEGNTASSTVTFNVSPPPEDVSDGETDPWWPLLAISIGSVVLFLVIALIIFILIKRKKNEELVVDKGHQKRDDDVMSWD